MKKVLIFAFMFIFVASVAFAAQGNRLAHPSLRMPPVGV